MLIPEHKSYDLDKASTPRRLPLPDQNLDVFLIHLQHPLSPDD